MYLIHFFTTVKTAVCWTVWHRWWLDTELDFPSVRRGLAVVPSAGTVSGCKMQIWRKELGSL